MDFLCVRRREEWGKREKEKERNTISKRSKACRRDQRKNSYQKEVKTEANNIEASKSEDKAGEETSNPPPKEEEEK